MKVSQLIEMLKQYPDEMEVTTQRNESFIHVVNIDDTVYLSTEKPIGHCNRSGEYVYPSDLPDYSAFSPYLDENLFHFEYTPLTQGE